MSVAVTAPTVANLQELHLCPSGPVDWDRSSVSSVTTDESQTASSSAVTSSADEEECDQQLDAHVKKRVTCIELKMKGGKSDDGVFVTGLGEAGVTDEEWRVYYNANVCELKQRIKAVTEKLLGEDGRFYTGGHSGVGEDGLSADELHFLQRARKYHSQPTAADCTPEKPVWKLKGSVKQWQTTRREQMNAVFHVLAESGFIYYSEKDEAMRMADDLLALVTKENVHEFELLAMATGVFWACKIAQILYYRREGQKWLISAHTQEMVDHGCQAWTLENMHALVCGEKSKKFKDTSVGGDYETSVGSAAGRKYGFSRAVVRDTHKLRKLDVRGLGDEQKQRQKTESLFLLMQMVGIEMPRGIRLNKQPEGFVFSNPRSQLQKAKDKRVSAYDSGRETTLSNKLKQKAKTSGASFGSAASSLTLSSLGRHRLRGASPVTGLVKSDDEMDEDTQAHLHIGDDAVQHANGYLTAKGKMAKTMPAFDAEMDEPDGSYIAGVAQLPDDDANNAEVVKANFLSAINFHALAAEPAAAAEQAAAEPAAAEPAAAEPAAAEHMLLDVCEAPEDPIAKLMREQAKQLAAIQAQQQQQMQALLVQQQQQMPLNAAGTSTSTSIVVSTTPSTVDSDSESEASDASNLGDLDENDDQHAPEFATELSKVDRVCFMGMLEEKLGEEDEPNEERDFFTNPANQSAPANLAASRSALAAQGGSRKKRSAQEIFADLPTGQQAKIKRAFVAQKNLDAAGPGADPGLLLKCEQEALTWWGKVDKQRLLDGEVYVPRKKKEMTIEQRAAALQKQADKQAETERRGAKKQERQAKRAAQKAQKVEKRAAREKAVAEKQAAKIRTEEEKMAKQSAAANQKINAAAQQRRNNALIDNERKRAKAEQDFQAYERMVEKDKAAALFTQSEATSDNASPPLMLKLFTGKPVLMQTPTVKGPVAYYGSRAGKNSLPMMLPGGNDADERSYIVDDRAGSREGTRNSSKRKLEDKETCVDK